MMNRLQKRALREILASLKNDARSWKFGQHDASNGLAYIWIGNRYYGTNFKYGAIQYEWNFPFWFLLPSEWWRVKLIRAVEKAQAIQIWGE